MSKCWQSYLLRPLIVSSTGEMIQRLIRTSESDTRTADHAYVYISMLQTPVYVVECVKHLSISGSGTGSDGRCIFGTEDVPILA